MHPGSNSLVIACPVSLRSHLIVGSSVQSATITQKNHIAHSRSLFRVKVGRVVSLTYLEHEKNHSPSTKKTVTFIRGVSGSSMAPSQLATQQGPPGPVPEERPPNSPSKLPDNHPAADHVFRLCLLAQQAESLHQPI